jgi:hypothetical protein
VVECYIRSTHTSSAAVVGEIVAVID